MKLELRENMYYRTIAGHIGKIVSIKEFNEKEYLLNGFYINKDTIKIASFNIIDLIEVGDYVNGYYVEDILKTFINVATESNYFQSPTIYEQDIKSIVTKEEFEQISYKVGE